MEKIIITYLVLTFLQFGYKGASGQNIVPDSSFEEYRELSKKDTIFLNESGWIISNQINQWHRVDKVSNTPDFFLFSASSHGAFPFGHQSPHSGNAFVHISFTKFNVECIEAKLKHPLQKGHYYKLSLFVSRAEQSGSNYLRAIPVLFMPEKYDKNKNYSYVPIIELKSDTTESLIDTVGWTRCSAIYLSKGDESWLMLGSYRRSYYEGKTFEFPLSKKDKNKAISNSASYVIDDVSLIEVDSLEKK